ncbi:MAG: 2-hydroxychromene-2-carboxylate isomerase [Alphaproteobacteria bacterium]|nr:2-hydroxychromene-2-carboxylate isomerase [Alphaproteobacteria bacterium]MBU1513583.1 2-hydroxychromene-2-carboxylate isomerase [Alphaproteobacteria bacterium]MBU2094772.1 2-hydroxychromene-2-carboxylate isomerase [Alphaproteobacteria bacterium]MBU2150159.1 2-hydroxychromene-2-carboxylate isomerase [Alphaproteobacteria bacterium]MBU2309312.1 2-hydroxychromene-2-carboxylate isomerase [Alphaproteobacteria bacterium]
MGKALEFLFDVGSPASYIAYKRLPEIAARTGATVSYRPFLLGGVFKATGNHSPAEIPAKGRWSSIDLANFAKRHGVPFARNPFFPINTLHLMRGAAGLQDDPRFMAYLDAVFDAMWQDPKNLGDPAEMAPVLARAGIDGDAFMSLIADDATKARLKATTDDAVARGAFGAPTFFVGDQMFFGQDRLDWVEEALAS